LKKCTTCHAATNGAKPGKDNLNGYGKDLQSADEVKGFVGMKKKTFTADELKKVADAIKAIGTKDSNGNGKSNDDDIKAGTAPGTK